MKSFKQFISEHFNETKIGHSTIGYINHPDHIELYSIRTPQKYRKQGHANKILKHLTDLADSVNKPIRLLASPLDKKTSTTQLINFYKKHNFELTGEKGNLAGDPYMIRKPFPTPKKD